MGLDLNYKVFGEGQPVIILHGLFGTLDNWQTLARQLAEEYMVFIIDQRNHGRSPHVDTIDYPSMAADLHAFMEANWLYDAYLVGHSMGGKTAMQFALEYGDMLSKLVVVDIGVSTYEPRHNHIIDAMTELPVATLGSRQEATDFLNARINSPGEVQFLLKNLARQKTGGYAWKMNLPVITANYAKILAGIESPSTFDGQTLFIKGGLSDHIRDNEWDAITSLFPAAQLEIIADANHWVHADKPDETLALLQNFFKS